MIANILFLVFCLAPVVVPQSNTTSKGMCPSVTIQDKFNETKFAGTWYEIKRFNNTLITGDCGRPVYKWNKSNYTVTYPTINLRNGLRSTTNFTLKKQFLYVPGKYDVYMNKLKALIPQYVLSTDYKTYGIVWGCSYRNNANTQQLFIYSRTSILSEAVYSKAIRPVLQYNRINETRLVNIVQDARRCGAFQL